MDELALALEKINELLLTRAIEPYAEDGEAMSKKAELIIEQLVNILGNLDPLQLPHEAIATVQEELD
jgi:hypothetical protein